jgi:hypothetical protein
MTKATSTHTAHAPHHTSDEHLGAVEGERPDTGEGNANALSSLDDQGMPRKDDVRIAEDVLGANEDETQG